MYIFKLITTFILLLGLSSCSGVKPIKKSRYSYDKDVERDFEEIEREKVLDYYFQLRLKDSQNKAAKRKQRRSKVKVYHPHKISKKPRPRKIKVNPEENKIRMEQMMSYYCIKNRHQENCLNFTKAVSQNCQDVFDLDDQLLIRCLEKKLGRM